MAETREMIRERLERDFAPLHLTVEDQSGRHAGHAGAGGGGHFAVTLVSAKFEGMSLIEQHRRVNEALAELFPEKVHALALRTYTPDQWRQAASTR